MMYVSGLAETLLPLLQGLTVPWLMDHLSVTRDEAQRLQLAAVGKNGNKANCQRVLSRTPIRALGEIHASQASTLQRFVQGG